MSCFQETLWECNFSTICFAVRFRIGNQLVPRIGKGLVQLFYSFFGERLRVWKLCTNVFVCI